MERLIFHVDVNSAFLSWEATKRVQNGEADLRLVPSVIGRDPSHRTSIVTARSIPAKAYGIQTAEPMSMALRKCPNLIWAAPDFQLYKKCSKAFKDICREYAPVVESFSIDEVFLDMTEMTKLYPDPIALAHTIKDRIRDDLGFTVNIGIGRNKLCAKMASDFEKPDKVHTLFPSEIEKKMWPLPIRDLFSVGKSSAQKLMAAGVRTIGDLAHLSPEEATLFLGKTMGLHALRFANGIDDSPVREEEEDAKGYSVETTLEEDIDDLVDINRLLLSLADIVSARLRKDDARCCCIGVSYKHADFKTKSHQKKLSAPTDVTAQIYETACSLFLESWDNQPIRLIGIALTDIDRDGFEQMSFLVDEHREKMKKLDTALDSIRTRYGDDSIHRGTTYPWGRS